jgi:glutamate-1-semialdehyde aminotransferase
MLDQVIVSGFYNPDLLRDQFRQFGYELACFVVEPFIGVGGFAPAEGWPTRSSPICRAEDRSRESEQIIDTVSRFGQGTTWEEQWQRLSG